MLQLLLRKQRQETEEKKQRQAEQEDLELNKLFATSTKYESTLIALIHKTSLLIGGEGHMFRDTRLIYHL